MRFSANGGTDAATIILFWPENLPDNARDRWTDDPLSLFEELRSAGRLIWFPCDGDGGYGVTIYLDEPLPESLAAFCKDAEDYPSLLVRGPGYFGGAECMFPKDGGRTKQIVGMLGRIDLPSGDYRAQMFRMEIPDGHVEEYLSKATGDRAWSVWKIHSWVAALAVFGGFATLISFFFLPWTAWAWVAGSTALCVALAVLLSRTQAYSQVRSAQEDYGREFPSYAVALRSNEFDAES